MKNKETYVAIDFEHVTEIQAICQVGYVYVVDGQPAERERRYIDPKVGDFSDDFASIHVHHITPRDVEGKETFGEFWKQFIEKYGKETWVFHNAKSDIETLKKNLCYAGMREDIEKIPNVIDTMQIYGGHSLEDVTAAFDVNFVSNHDALEDAEACACIYLYYLRGVPHKEIVNEGVGGKNIFETYKKKHISHDVLQKDLSGADPTNPFYDKKVVITGNLDAYPVRNDLATLLKSFGADVDTCVSKRTNYVIMGKKAGPAKQKKIAELQQQGYLIQVLNEEELLKILNKQ